MTVLVFLVCLCASCIGAIVGAGGGVVIKPVMDALGVFTASQISFLSGCTVLAMSLSSLIRGRKNGVKLDTAVSTPLAVGAVAGGLLGKKLFDLVKCFFGSERMLGGVQSVSMSFVLFVVLAYLMNKSRLPSLHIRSRLIAVVIGLVLGLVSSFLGIGGGTLNVATILFFFSDDAKQAARNSIYVILFSQTANLLFSAATGNIPQFEAEHLLLMILGGVGGGIIGSSISKRLDCERVERLLMALVVVVAAITIRNACIAFI